ncbi:MAG: hypothetical protein H7138_16565 [Myxococcales bacterium]|nr:hypothetical protein [Myxococcales bacterium]
MKTAALLMAAAAAGCVAGSPETDEAPAPEPVTDPAIGDQDSYIAGDDCQGRRLLGATPDDLSSVGQTFVSFGAESSNRPGVFVSVSGGDLVAKSAAGKVLYSGTSASFIGMRLRAPSGGEVEISAVSTQTYGTSYALRFGISGGDYCGGAGNAVPLQGIFESDRYHVHHSNVSFACDDGVAKKCEGWGYVAGSDPNSLGWKHHQACMRMANADVYGNGETHTREETPVVIRDLMPGAKPAPLDAPALDYPTTAPTPTNVPFFEGAWSADRGRGAVCLAKPRWASLPADAPDHPSLPDPRKLLPGQPNPGNVAFCEDLTIEQMRARGALVFNASKKMDMYLNRWRNPATGQLLATVRGEYYADSLRRMSPAPGYTEFLGSDGILLRNLTGTLAASDVTPMYLQHNVRTGDYVVATQTPVSPDHVIEDLERDFEGYTLNFTGPELTALALFRLGDDYVTSVGGPGTIGYTQQGVLHAVMQPNWAGPSASATRKPGFSPRATGTGCKSPQ